MAKYDSIHPAHYKVGNSTEHYRIVAEAGLGYCLGCATKYIFRAGKKPGVDALEDLHKAIRFIEMEISNIEYDRAKNEPPTKR